MNTIVNVDVLYAPRDKARAKVEESIATLARAQRIKTSADERVQELEKALETATTEQAHRLEAAISAGAPTDDASPPNLDAHAIALDLTSAKLHTSIAVKALESIKSTNAQREAELQAAERAVINAVDQLLDREQIETAMRIQHHIDEVLRLGRPLLGEVIGDGLSTRRHTPEPVKKVLEKLDYPLLDRRHVAVNFVREGDQAALALRAARRAALIAGEISLVADAAA